MITVRDFAFDADEIERRKQRYVGLPDDEDDFDFKERFTQLKAEFEAQLVEESKLNKVIVENLQKVKLG